MDRSSDNFEQVVKSFVSIAKGASLYPETHPAVMTPLNNVSGIIRDLHDKKESVSFGVINGLLFFEDFVFYEETAAVNQFATHLDGKRISTICILKGFENDHLFELLKLLATQDPSLAETGAIRDILSEKGIGSITVKYVDEEDIEARAKKTYNDAIDVVASTFNEVRMGRIPKLDQTKKIVKEMVDIILTDHNAMTCLTMIKAYDNYTFNHSVNVSILAVAIAKALKVEEKNINEIGMAALLHDIGKTNIDKEIIKKPGKLTDDEFDLMKQHPPKGVEILQQTGGISKNILEIVSQHHVHYDRNGYPKMGIEEELNPFSTIITTADIYDAITTLRPYQAPVTPKEAIDIMISLENKYFEKDVLRKFIDILGLYPTGSFIRLDSNEIALVTKQNPVDPMLPVVKVVVDSDGNKLAIDDIIELDMANESTGDTLAKAIVSPVDPTFIGLSLADYI